MRIDLTCPVELWHFQLPTRAFPVCTLQLFNLTDKPVESIQAVFVCYDQKGEQISRQVERVQGLEGQPRSAMEMSVVIEGGVEAADLEFIIEKAWFSDATVWRRETGHATEYTPNSIKGGRRLEVLKFVAGADATGYPSDQGAVWLCVCGRPNAASENVCRRCGRGKHDIFTKYNEAAIEKVIFARENELEEKARRAREDAGRIAKDREEKFSKKRRRRRIIIATVTTLAVTAGIAYGIYFHGIPFYQYYTAGRRLENGEYAAARGLYSGLEDYRDSAQLVQECDYRSATVSMKNGTLTSLKVAQDTFDALGAYTDSAALAKDMRFRRAELLTMAGQYDQALAVYDEIPDYSGVSARRDRTEYLYAKKMMSDLDYEAAREKFLSLGSYEDAAALADQSLYLPAIDYMGKSDYLSAVDLLVQLPDYPGAQTRLQECYYRQGELLFTMENYDEAAEYFLKAGDYLDAWRQATACLYAPAVDAMEAGEYERAKAMFDKILTYQDAQALSWECTYQIGLALMQAKEYDAAAALFETIPEHAAAQEARLECVYIPALEFADTGKEAEALALFEKIPEYKDSASYISKLRYNDAIRLMNVRDYGAAIPLLELLGSYEDSAEELRNAQYGYAIAQLEAGQYQDAIDRFTGLGKYLSSAEYLQKAYYQYGKYKMDAGEFAAAALLFEKTSGYEDSDVLKNDSLYNAAALVAAAGDQAAAAALYMQIKEYKDAGGQYAKIMYSLAAANRESGNFALAGQQFAEAGSYLDAAEQSEACYDAYYADSYTLAKESMGKKDYETVVAVLSEVTRTGMIGKYSDIPDIYNEANYLLANRLYDNKKPFEALKYYRNILDYKDVSSKKLDRVCYRMLGKWSSTKGVVMIFREDGTCSLDGREYYFYAKNYSLETGTNAEELKQTYQIVSSGQNAMTLRNLKTKVLYRLTRVKGE